MYINNEVMERRNNNSGFVFVTRTLTQCLSIKPQYVSACKEVMRNDVIHSDD
jgi:hypothetical protein